ncbi:prolyl oligopeptidase family serine peptidase [Winogradskyella flava]|uniref:carboxylesterase family protein n=1 Tax=Winogradskyella flava TaxID=1884876 RepID=UPI002490B5BA|nr:prolyl oligopeptidase family serine peptidase [Winogradskyella flava]
MRVDRFFVLIALVSLIASCDEASNNKESITVLRDKSIDSLLTKYSFKASNGLEIPYRLFNPKDSAENKKPLLVFLHGRGDRGTDNNSKVYHEAGFITNKQSLLTSEMQQKYPCYILVPQCSDKTDNEEWAKWIGNTPESPFEGLGKDGSYNMNPKPSESGEAAIELIEQTLKDYKIDANRVYLVGISMGGFGTWEFISRRPDLFAAAVPMAGYSDPNQIENIKHIPTWIFHGNIDKWNPVEGSRHMYKLLLEKNADVKYTEYDNTSHGDAFKNAFKEEELLPWIFSKTKSNTLD